MSQRFDKQQDFIQMVQSNLTSFEQQRKLSNCLRLKITFKVLVVSYTKEFVVVVISTLVKQGETQKQAQTKANNQTLNWNLLNTCRTPHNKHLIG